MALINPQWRDQQQEGKYPFEDRATLVSYEGAVISKDTLLDASLYPVGGGVGMYLAAVRVGVPMTTLYIGIPGNTALCSGQFSTQDAPHDLPLEDIYGRPAGILVSEPIRLAAFQSWRPGLYTFAPDATPFAASACIPVPENGVRAIKTAGGQLFVGNVILYGEQGVVLSLDAASTDDKPIIRVDVVGEPLFRRAACEDPADYEETEEGIVAKFANRSYLRTINGSPPDEYGNYMVTTANNIAIDNILRIYPSAEGLRVEVIGQRVGSAAG